MESVYNFKNTRQQIELNESLELVRSHVGMIIQSTTLDTEDKVIAIYGGTSWSKIEGRFLFGASSSYAVNSTGGEATHKLTTAEMPSHSHTVSGNFMQWTSGNVGAGTGTTMNGNTNVTTNSTGGNTAHNNMPPYMAVYIWVRTA